MKRLFRLLLTSVFVTSLILLNTVQSNWAEAQGGGAIAYGDVVVGEITNTEPEVSYVFVGNADDILIIICEPEDFSSDLEPRVTVTAPDGEELIMSEALFRVETAIRLLVDGKYTLTVSRYDGESGDTTGSYQLTFLQPDVLEIGDSVTDSIDSSETHYYSLLGYSSFRVTYMRQSGTFGPVVAVTPVDAEEDIFSLGGFDSIGSVGGAGVTEGMMRIDHEGDAFIVTVSEAFLAFSFGSTPATYSIEISE